MEAEPDAQAGAELGDGIEGLIGGVGNQNEPSLQDPLIREALQQGGGLLQSLPAFGEDRLGGRLQRPGLTLQQTLGVVDLLLRLGDFGRQPGQVRAPVFHAEAEGVDQPVGPVVEPLHQFFRQPA